MNSSIKYIFGRKYGNTLVNSLIAGYLFEDDINDVTSNHNAYKWDVPNYVTGKNGKAADLGTVTDANYIAVLNSTEFTPFNGTEFSISAWMNFDLFNSNSNTVASKRGGVNFEWQFSYSSVNNGWQYNKWSNNTNTDFLRYVLSSSPPSIGTWHHVVLTDDGTGNIVIYFNNIPGTPSLSETGTFVDVINTPADMVIGSNPSAPTQKHKGKLDEVYFFNKVLTPTEVSFLYNTGLGKFYPFN